MEYEIIESPFCVTLFGFRGALEGQAVHVVGKPLMDALWLEVRNGGLKTKGINHWVYLPHSEMFTGVELAAIPANGVGKLEQLDVSLGRHLRHVHKGSYSLLPQMWPRLLDDVKQRGEAPIWPNLEIYGHWEADESKCETTILIGLG